MKYLQDTASELRLLHGHVPSDLYHFIGQQTRAPSLLKMVVLQTLTPNVFVEFEFCFTNSLANHFSPNHSQNQASQNLSFDSPEQ